MKRYFEIAVLFFAILFVSCENSFFSNAAEIYKVKFSTNGGTSLSEVYTNEISESPYSQKTDCDLEGWYLSSNFSGERVNFPFKVTGETTLYAKWLQKYNVTFSINGGSEIPSQLTTKIETAPLSFKEDYELEGWYENADFSGGKVLFPYAVTKATILYAKWTKTYNATFETNGGTDVAPYKVSTISSSPETTKNGFDFAGWYFTEDFSGKTATFPYTLASDTKFYAKWAEIFTITFDTNGGSAIETISASKIEAAPEITKENADFLGWYEASDFSGEAVKFPYIPTKDITLYAKWYNWPEVTFVTNGGSEVASLKTKLISTSPVTTKQDADLVGWYETSDFSSEEIKFPYNITKNTTLYAKWSERYTVTFNANGGSAVAMLKIAKIEAAPETTKTGNTLEGWYKDSLLTQKAEFPLLITENTTLYAKWIPTKYTISYNANGATSGIVPNSEVVEHGTSYTISDNTGGLEKIGSEFINWNTKADGSGKSYVAGTQITVTENLTLYARWMTEAELSSGAWNYPTSTPEITWAGNGTEESPYIIRSAQQLADLAYMVNYGTSYSGKYFILKNDIDLNKDITVNADSASAKEWHPIGNSASYYFAGDFDGNGHTINGLYINSANYIYAGLFGYVSSGKVRNVILGQGYIANTFSTAKSYTGAVAGCLGKGGEIHSCGNEATVIVDADASNYSHVGGIVGHAGGATTNSYGETVTLYAKIYNSYNKAIVRGHTSKGYVGGICGYLYNYNYIYNSYNSGSLTGNCVGGIVGYSYGFDDKASSSSNARNYIYNCYNRGKLSGSSSYTGGIVGYNYCYLTINYCYYSSESATEYYGYGYIITKGVGSFSSAISSVSDGYVSGGTVYQCLNDYVNGNNSEGLLCDWKEIDGWPGLGFEN